MTCSARLVTVDVPVPVIVVILLGCSPSHPLVVVGAGAAPRPRRALRLALEEACLSLFGMNRLVRNAGAEVASLPDDELRSLTAQSTAFAVRPDLVDGAPFLFGGDEGAGTVALKDLDARFHAVADGALESLVAALGDWAKEAAVVDCTTPDIRDIGVRVVRVVVPGLRPLDHDAAIPHLGGERWLDRPRHHGPHPFP
jgi:ribosomal protein S12 methylthiotransferase accessory factor